MQAMILLRRTMLLGSLAGIVALSGCVGVVHDGGAPGYYDGSYHNSYYSRPGYYDRTGYYDSYSYDDYGRQRR